MFRYTDGSYNNMPSGRPVSSLSSGSTDSGSSAIPSQLGSSSRPVSGPPSPAFQLNNYLHMTNWMAVGAQQQQQRKRERESSRAPPMGGEVHFSQHIGAPQHDILGFNEPSAFAASAASRQQPTGKKSPKPDSYKTVMCQAWLESKVCSFAENCRFAHGEAELRPSKIMPKQNSKYKTKLCDKYTTTGLCPYGSRCLFIHPDNGNNAYIRPDKLVEVSQRHALADMTVQHHATNNVRPVTPEMPPFEALFGGSAGHLQAQPPLRPHPSWPLEPAAFFQEKNEDDPQQGTALDVKGLFGCFDAASTPNRVSLASGLSGYASGGSSPFSTVSCSSANLNISSDDEKDFERDYFRITGLEHLAEELTRNLTTTEPW